MSSMNCSDTAACKCSLTCSGIPNCMLFCKPS